MGSTVLEITRATHEDIERTQKAIIEELGYAPRNFKQNVIQTNRISKYLNNISDNKDKLVRLYEDADGTRKEEISAIGGSGTTLFSTFYEKLRELKDYHRRFPGLEPDHPDDHIYVSTDAALPPFTGEERYGRCLDLHEFYERFINLQEIKKIATNPNSRLHKLLYIDYVQNIFHQFDDVLERKDEEYKQYLKDLQAYLISFLERSQPLFDLQPELKQIDIDFETAWQNGEFRWNIELPFAAPDKPSKEAKKRKQSQQQTNGTSSTSNENNENNPLYCKYCHKAFAKETVFTGHLKGKKHIQAVEREEAKQAKFNSPVNFKEFYGMEFKIHELCTKLLSEQIDETKTNIEKRQARSAEELLMDDEEEDAEYEFNAPEEEEDSESENELEIKTTIENYPIGWDGKPIPYWLYKLHGLGVEYNCEICGNTSYYGRKAYEKHFQEWRHAHGMRCLGIPNSKHFHDITKINDALALWEKIRRDTSTQAFRPEAEEEFEDKEGNVFSKKTYEDLKRQGLL